ncbi:hypothetical protein ACFQX6_55865 [Streptosporangium lutulentum]
MTHSGVNLAPELGRLAAEEIVTGGESADLSGYRVTRDVAASVQDESLSTMTSR